MDAAEQILDHPKKSAALRALLDEPTITAAASAAGVGRSTLHEWLRDPDFADAYRQMRRDALEAATARLQQNAARAAEVLREIMDSADAPPSSRIAAADKTLQHASNYSDLEEIDEMIAELKDWHE